MAKRLFDIALSAFGLILSWWVILIAILVATIDTRSFGLFTQKRVGREGRQFRILKIRTMRRSAGGTTVTTLHDARITRLGYILRRLKIDELPQLLNVLVGQMSFVGPRPDVPGFADQLIGDQRIVLSVRPGITGPATIYFRDEETLLSECDDPENYNRNVLFPMKVQLNMRYIRDYRFTDDLRLIWATVIGLSYQDLYGDATQGDL